MGSGWWLSESKRFARKTPIPTWNFLQFFSFGSKITRNENPTFTKMNTYSIWREWSKNQDFRIHSHPYDEQVNLLLISLSFSIWRFYSYCVCFLFRFLFENFYIKPNREDSMNQMPWCSSLHMFSLNLSLVQQFSWPLVVAIFY